MNLNSAIKNKSGVSLIESLISILLVLLAFAGLFQFFSFGYFRLKSVKNRLATIHICQEWLEEMLSLRYSDIHLVDGETAPVTIDYGPDYDSETDDLIGTRTVTIKDWTISGETIGKRLIVTVSWQWKTKELSETLGTAIYNLHNE